MDLFVLLVIYPLALWLVACLSVMVRFLVYLDTRIRLEGWEVELAMQAEALRQFGDQHQLPTTVESSLVVHATGKTSAVLTGSKHSIGSLEGQG